jgi:PIN domain nuclease of toxin-antitoxin system
MTAAIALRSRTISLPHEDPADRFIAATAIEMRLPLATVNTRLLACAELRCC